MTSLPVPASGCGEKLHSKSLVMAFYPNWDDKPVKLEGTLDEFFSMDFDGFACGYKWYSKSEAENVFVLCETCMKRLGWKW